MNGTPWTPRDVERLKRYVAEGRSLAWMARALTCCKRRVERKMRYLKLSVRAARMEDRDLPAEAAAAWSKHGTTRAVRRELGVSQQAASRALRDAGIEPCAAQRRAPRPSALPDATLRKLAAQGYTRYQIAAETGAPYSTVVKRCQALGLDPPRSVYGTGAPRGAKPVPRPEGIPCDWEELSDAIARWGIEGAAEEYEVSEAQIMRWRTELCGEAT